MSSVRWSTLNGLDMFNLWEEEEGVDMSDHKDYADRAAEIKKCATIESCELLPLPPPDDYVVGEDEYYYIGWDDGKLAAIIRSESPEPSTALVEAAKEYMRQVDINDGIGGTQQDFDLEAAKQALRSALSDCKLAPDVNELVEAARELEYNIIYLLDTATIPFPENKNAKFAVRVAAEKLRAALSDCKPRVCEWEYDIEVENYRSRCRPEYETDYHYSGGKKFCPDCGGKIEVKEK